MTKDEWRTPPEVFNWARGLVDEIYWDAACTADNALATPLWRQGRFKEGDSLSASWPDNTTIWCNPPYSNIDPWIDAALDCQSVVAMLIMSPNGEERFARLIPRAHEIHIVGRLAFISGNGKPVAGNTRGSSLFLINARWGAGQRSIVTRDEVMGRTVEAIHG